MIYKEMIICPYCNKEKEIVIPDNKYYSYFYMECKKCNNIFEIYYEEDYHQSIRRDDKYFIKPNFHCDSLFG